MARRRLFAVHRAQWRSAEARRALRLDVEQEFPGPAGSGWAHAFDEPGNGGRRGAPRPPGRRARIRSEEIAPWKPFQSCPVSLSRLTKRISTPTSFVRPASTKCREVRASRRFFSTIAASTRRIREARLYPQSRAIPSRRDRGRGSQFRRRLVERNRRLRSARLRHSFV